MNPSLAAAWSDAWSDRRFRRSFALTLPLFGLSLAALSSFLEFVEDRPGVGLPDPILTHIAPVQLTWITFSLIYLCLILGILFLARTPRRLLIAVQSYVLMVAFRILMMYAVPLEAPAGLIPLADPLVQFFGTGRIPTKDLFFSGHASTLFLLFLTVQHRPLRGLFLACTAAVGLAVILQHVHYTIDVLVAPFMAYTCYRIIVTGHERGERRARRNRLGPPAAVALAALLSLSMLSPAGLRAAPGGANDPAADPKAIVTSGPARFTVLTPSLLRLEWSPDGLFEDHASLVVLNRRLPVPDFSRSDEGETLIIRTPALELRYRKGSGRFTAQNLEIRYSLNGHHRSWRPGMADTANLGGTIRTLDGVEGATKLDPGLLSRDGWTVVDDSERPLFDDSPWPWVTPRPSGERQDLYFFGYGHAYKDALRDFTVVAGKIPMPPRFAFGTWWSRYWSYTDEEFKELVQQFAIFSVPLDVLVIDMDWHLTFNMRWRKDVKDQAGQRLGWTGYTWDPNVFPDPAGFLAWCRSRGLKTTLNIHPASGIQPHETVYPEMARAMGIDPATKKYVPFDITDKKFARNYMDLVMHPLQREGIDFFWLDWQQWSKTAVPGVTPTWWLNYVFFTDMEREGKARPLLFHRWGGLGNHRYQIGFSGDVVSVWPSLAFQPYFTATAANVGFGYWSHDIGGHQPGVVSPELYTRWIQFGVFSPILRTHTTKNPGAERRIWAYPVNDFLRMREAFLLRYALIPYLYTSARQTYDSGVSLVHPLYYDYPEAGDAYAATDEYLFGDQMLVAPVLTPLSPDSMLAPRRLWLPPGQWYEWETGTLLTGGRRLTRCYALDEIPVFLRAGAVIPMQAPPRNTASASGDPLILTIAPGDSGAVRVYDDAGNSTAYQKGEGAWTPVRFRRTGDRSLAVEIGPADGNYPGMPAARALEIVLPSVVPPSKVTVNGKELARSRNEEAGSWSYDGDRATLRVRTASCPVRELTKVKITMPPDAAALEDALNGFPARLARLRRIMPVLNNQWPREWSPPALIDAVQTGNRIGLNPASLREELQRFGRLWQELPGLIRTMEISDSTKTGVLNHMTAGL